MLFLLHSSLFSKRLHSLSKFLLLSSFNFPIRRQFSNAKISFSNCNCISSAPTLNMCHHYFIIYINIHIYILPALYICVHFFPVSMFHTGSRTGHVGRWIQRRRAQREHSRRHPWSRRLEVGDTTRFAWSRPLDHRDGHRRVNAAAAGRACA